jgi:hypothetical protein
MTYARRVLLSRSRAVTASALVALAVVAAPAVTVAVAGAPAAQGSVAAKAGPGVPARSLAAPATPGQRIAAALRTSPLYVDPSLNAAFPPGVRATLLRQISRAPVPVFILAVPLPGGGEWANGAQLATVVHDYLGRNGIYLTIDVNFSNQIDAYTWPSDPYGTDAPPYNAADAALAANLASATREAGLAEKFLRCVELVSDGQAVPAYQAALRQIEVPQVAAHRSTGLSQVLIVVLIVLIAIAAAIACTAAGLWLLRRRQPRPSPELQPEGGPGQPSPAWSPGGRRRQPVPASLRGAVASARGAASSDPARRLLTRVRSTSQRIINRGGTHPR